MSPPAVRLQRLVAVLLTLACMAVAGIALRLTENSPEYQTVRGLPGHAVRLRGGAVVTVGSPSVGRALLGDGKVVVRTAGVYVLVPLTIEATQTKATLSEAKLVSGNRTYKPFGLFSIDCPAGFRCVDAALFEVDPARMEGLAIELSDAGVVRGYYQLVHAPLGITAGNAAAWRAAAQGRVLEPPGEPQTEAIP